MLVIRLKRVGKKNQPFYRLVLAEHARPVKGKFIEILGSYNPFSKKAQLKKEEILKWLGKGAKPSNTAAKILVKEGLKHPLIIVKKSKKHPKKQEANIPESSIPAKKESPQEKPEEKKKEIDDMKVQKEKQPATKKEEKKPKEVKNKPKKNDTAK